ncbi:chromatin segregation and condensation protein Rec8/ScpA/Scc1 (kleisin family) [Anoxybacillus rupiensis]|nr:chromatin segregation and condensation protein Rec8/ScpA/Scc1 (kleisin family) [Anoxybacillus rupiensis]
MAKKASSMKQQDEAITLQDRLHVDLYEQLRAKKKSLEEVEQRKKEEEEAQRREEKRQREKQKTFEELLNESNLDWRRFK